MKKGILAVLGVVFLLAPVVFVSGCVEGGDLQSIFSSLTGQQETVVAPKDVLLIQDIQVIPSPPITASTGSIDSTFTLTFQVVNIGEAQEGSKEADLVKVYGYDWGRCEPRDAIVNDMIQGLQGQETSDISIFPGGGAEIVQWEFKAPTNEDLGRMEGKCPIRFKLQYQFDAHTTSDIAVVSKQRLIEASRAGQTISVTPVQTQSRGPIKISVNYDTKQPVAEDLVIPVIIKVHDVGSGMYEKVPNGILEVDFPFPDDWVTCYNFDMEPDSGKWKNQKEIPLIKGETPIIRCDINTQNINIEDIKTYNIRADMTYTYTLYGEKDVTIKPTYTGED